MKKIMKFFVLFWTICLAYGLEAQTYRAVTLVPACPTFGVACQYTSFQGGLCLSLDYLNIDNPPYSVRLKMTLAGGGNFPSNGIMSVYEGGICGYSIAYVSYTSSQSSRTITVPLTFPAGTTKSYYITMTPNTIIPPNIVQRWAGPFQIQAVACSTNVPLLSSPANGHVYASNTVNGGVGWSANGNNYTVTYKVTVKDMSTNPITVLVNNQPTQATFLSFSGLIAGHNYQWFVKAEKYGCTTTTSATRTFSVAAPPAMTCGTVKIFVPQNGGNNIARSTLVRWEHELGRGITKYSLVFRKVSTNQVVTVKGLDSNMVTVPTTNIPAILGFSINNSTDLDTNTVYRITLRAFNASNQQLSNNVNPEFIFRTMIKPVEQAGCPAGTDGKNFIIPYNYALGHFDNVVVHKNGLGSLGLQVPGYRECEYNATSITTVINPGGLNITNTAGRQCVEYIRRYVAMRYGYDMTTYSHAYKFFPTYNPDGTIAIGGAATAQSIKAYRNGIDTILPQPGDVIVFDKNSTYTAGHIAIVKAVNAGSIVLAQENMGNPTGTSLAIVVAKAVDLHLNYTRTFTGGSGGPVSIQAGLTPVLGLLRSEPRMFVELGASKTATGNNTMIQFNGQPSFKIDVHAGTPVFSLDLVQLNPTTNCYSTSIVSLTNLSNDGAAISGIPTLVNGKYKARVTCTTNGVASRPVYFERISALAGGADDRTSDESTKTQIQMSLMPNPAQHSVTLVVTCPYDGVGNITIYDATDKQVMSRDEVLSSGEQRFEIQTETLANGIYLCRLQTEHGDVIIKKLVILH